MSTYTATPKDIEHRWLVVDAEGCNTDARLSKWIKKGIDFALTLPPK